MRATKLAYDGRAVDNACAKQKGRAPLGFPFGISIFVALLMGGCCARLPQGLEPKSGATRMGGQSPLAKKNPNEPNFPGQRFQCQVLYDYMFNEIYPRFSRRNVGAERTQFGELWRGDSR